MKSLSIFKKFYLIKVVFAVVAIVVVISILTYQINVKFGIYTSYGLILLFSSIAALLGLNLILSGIIRIVIDDEYITFIPLIGKKGTYPLKDFVSWRTFYSKQNGMSNSSGSDTVNSYKTFAFIRYDGEEIHIEESKYENFKDITDLLIIRLDNVR